MKLALNTTVGLRLDDRTGAAYTVQAKIPAHWGGLKTFDVAAPLYILGTHFESHTGTWHLKILINGVLARTAAFQWQPATPADLEQIKTAVDGSPLNPDLHWRYGAALALLGHPRQAVTELQNAIRLQPDYALYYITLGRIYQEEHRAPDATAQFQKALTIRGSYYDSVFARWARAGLAKLQGQ